MAIQDATERVIFVVQTPETVATQQLQNLLLQVRDSFAAQGHDTIAQPDLQKDALREHRSVTNKGDKVQATEYETSRVQDSDVDALLTLVSQHY